MKPEVEQIYAVSSFHFHDHFDTSGSSNDDCYDTCVIWNEITYYGFPDELDEKYHEKIENNDYSDGTYLGKIKGCLILCKQMIDEGEDPHLVCDDLDADLEYVISALSDPDQPLDENPFQDIFYIHEFVLIDAYQSTNLKRLILERLPSTLLKLFHVKPDLIAFYPEPLEHEPNLEDEKKSNLLSRLAMHKIDSAFSPENTAGNDSGISSVFSSYQFSEDDLNIIMGRRNSSSGYPAHAKDEKEFLLYQSAGFAESGNSRLLFKQVHHL